jgi:hypothetical protein
MNDLTRGPALTVAAVLATAFGALTILEGGRALFGGAEMGAVVPFVLWFNFTAGFAYVLAGLGLWQRAPWARWLSLAILLATTAVLLAFAIHVWSGGAYDTRGVID